MATTKNFISLENLALYDELIKSVIAEGDAKSIKAAALDGKTLDLYTIENPTSSDTPRFSITLPFTQETIVGTNGTSKIFNESSGGGSKFEHNDGTWSYVGTNDGGESGITAQIYSVKQTNGKYIGSRINVTTNGIYYTNSQNSDSYDNLDEIATKRDVGGDAETKTVYITETSGSSDVDYSKKYSIYQGAQGSSSNPRESEKLSDIFIPKDMVVSDGSVKRVTVKDVPYEGAQIGDYYIDLTIANSDSKHIYIPANSLVNVYTAAQDATEVQLAISNDNEISATIVAIDGSKLVDGSVAKVKLVSGVQNSLDLADSALQDEDISEVDSADIEALFS